MDSSDITGGLLYDNSGWGNHASMSGEIGTRKTGVLGEATSFDGVDDTATVSDAVLEGVSGLSAITLSAWVNTGGVGGDSNKLLFKGSEFSLQVGYSGTNKVRFEVHTDAYYGISSANAVASNTWTHVLGTYDGSTQRLYIDGTEVVNGTPTTAGAITGSTDTLEISHSGGMYSGLVDDVRIFNRALSPSEVERLSEMRSPANLSVTNPTIITSSIRIAASVDGGEVLVTVYEDVDGDGIAENEESFRVSDDTSYYAPSRLLMSSSYNYWATVDTDNANETTTIKGTDLEIKF